MRGKNPQWGVARSFPNDFMLLIFFLFFDLALLSLAFTMLRWPASNLRSAGLCIPSSETKVSEPVSLGAGESNFIYIPKI